MSLILSVLPLIAHRVAGSEVQASLQVPAQGRLGVRCTKLFMLTAELASVAVLGAATWLESRGELPHAEVQSCPSH